MVYTTHENGDDWGMVYCCYINITSFQIGVSEPMEKPQLRLCRSAKGVGLRLVHWAGTEQEVNITARWGVPGGSRANSRKISTINGGF